MGGASTNEMEDTAMHVPTRSDLGRRSLTDLNGLLRQAFDEAAAAPDNSPAQRRAEAAKQTIRREITAHPPAPK